MKNFPLGFPTVHLGPPHIWEIITARKLIFYTHLDGTLLGYESFSAMRRAGVQRP